jgi:SWI/SNF-related matrix-associated actin-dependent regulator of chromatin subfamily A3
VKYITAFPRGEKSLIFSQFTKFLEKIEPHLKRAGIKTVRLDGSMPQKRRAEIIDEFQNTPGGAGALAGADDEEEEEQDVKPDIVDVDSSATEISESDSEATEYGSDDDDFVPDDTKKRKTRSQGAKQLKPKRAKRDSKPKKFTTKAKAKGKAGTQMRFGDGPTVMLISLQAGSQGLNLTAAQVCARLA